MQRAAKDSGRRLPRKQKSVGRGRRSSDPAQARASGE